MRMIYFIAFHSKQNYTILYEISHLNLIGENGM
jgi:hypothetical protein